MLGQYQYTNKNIVSYSVDKKVGFAVNLIWADAFCAIQRNKRF